MSTGIRELNQAMRSTKDTPERIQLPDLVDEVVEAVLQHSLWVLRSVFGETEAVYYYRTADAGPVPVRIDVQWQDTTRRKLNVPVATTPSKEFWNWAQDRACEKSSGFMKRSQLIELLGAQSLRRTLGRDVTRDKLSELVNHIPTEAYLTKQMRCLVFPLQPIGQIKRSAGDRIVVPPPFEDWLDRQRSSSGT